MAEDHHKRERFSSRAAFYFAAVGSAVGFGNVWRFPAKAYQFGGGAWFIPYLLALFLIGIPILFLEIGLGQYYQRGDISVFSGIHKRMRGVGMISVICGYMLLTYYVMLLTWVVRTIFESGSKSAPWQDENASVDSSESYFFTTIVGMDGREYPERLIWPNVGYCALTYLIIFLCTAFGIKVTGQITYITMGLPVLILFVFLIRGCTLEGSSDGIKAYIGEWDMSVLRDQGDSWSEAVSQIFFSLSVTFGVMTAYGSHMKRDEPAFLNSCVVAFANSIFSFISGFAVFSAIGHKAFLENKEVDELTGLSGFSLVFGTWPVVLKTLPGGIHWIRLLFITLFMLGLDSAFSFVEAMVTVARDTKRFRTTPKWKISAVFCIVSFFLSLIYATNVGLIFLDVVDYYINFVMLLVGFFEAFGVAWIYGIEDQLEKFGAPVFFTYMVTTFGSVLCACAFWFGLSDADTAVWVGFVVLILFYGIGIVVTNYLLQKKISTDGIEKSLLSAWSDLAFGNMNDFKATLEPTIGWIPQAWCYLIKHFIPQILLILFINLAVSKNSSGKSNFGNYGDYKAWPYQTIGIAAISFGMLIFLAGLIKPDVYSLLDTHDELVAGEDDSKPSFPVKPLAEKIEGVDDEEVLEAKAVQVQE